MLALNARAASTTDVPVTSLLRMWSHAATLCIHTGLKQHTTFYRLSHCVHWLQLEATEAGRNSRFVPDRAALC